MAAGNVPDWVVERREAKRTAINSEMPRWLEEHGVPEGAISRREAFSHGLICSHHEDRNPSCTVLPDGVSVRCHACGRNYDVIDLMMDEWGCDYNEALDRGAAWAGYSEALSLDGTAPKAAGGCRATRDAALAANDAEYLRAIAGKGLDEPEATAYLASRGISPEVAASFGCGYDPEWRSPAAIAKLARGEIKAAPPATKRIIVPTGEASYLARSIGEADPHYNPKFKKQKEGEQAGFFGGGNVERADNEGRPLWVVEGEFDAMSLAQCGVLAVALGSTSRAGAFVKSLPDGYRVPIIVMLDRDEPGRKASDALVSALKGRGLKADGITESLFGICESDCTDPNELAVSMGSELFGACLGEFDRKFSELVLPRCEEPAPDGARKRPTGLEAVSADDYIRYFMADDMGEFTRGTGRKWGFGNMDGALGDVRCGLYVIGAAPSVGKTTLAHQIADNLAGQHVPVLFVSLEQTRLELVSKSVARELAKKHGASTGAAQSSLEIRSGKASDSAKECLREYAEKVAPWLHIIKGGIDGVSAPDIHKAVAGWLADHGGEGCPVVIVDYLQLISGSDPRMSDKQAADEVSHVLKSISVDYGATVIAISSYNRRAYYTCSDMASFKESGGIEYSADVVLGLQVSAIDRFKASGKNEEDDRRKTVEAAERETPRRITMDVLKNRYGARRQKLYFNYFPASDLFVGSTSKAAYAGEEPPKTLEEAGFTGSIQKSKSAVRRRGQGKGETNG